jgi:hypothetical protein
MKPLPAQKVPGNTEAERFEFAVRKVFIVSKVDFVNEEAKYKRRQARKRRARKSA